MKESILNSAKFWSQNSYFDQVDKDEVSKLIEENDEVELIERFEKDLEFGTGGMRSIIGMGRNRMNKYNVRKATQALSNAALLENPIKPIAAISYDCRNFSLEFAKEVACVFAANGIKAYIFKELTPTPMLSFAIRKLGAVTGVMVTASHNPKQYNGYKAYWSDGAQLTPPYDNKVIEEFKSITDFTTIKMANFESCVKEGMIQWMDEQINEDFYQDIINQSLNKNVCLEKGSELKAVYTSLHGTGLKPCLEISKRLGFTNFKALAEQAAYDPSFSTVITTPNPEDPKALTQVVKEMLDTNADIAYGTDPDCDRLGVVVNHNKEAVFLNGNQIAVLMIEYLFRNMKDQNKLPSKPLVLKSIVTSPLQNSIAESFGAEVIDTLTGFKWMSKKIKELELQKSGHTFIYASEESFGYMPNTSVRDKDAVASISLMNELTLMHKLNGKTLIDALDDIYTQYGFAKESLISNNYPGIEGQQKIQSIMNYFRTNFSKDIGDEKVRVFEDYQNSSSLNLKTKKKSILDITKSNVLGFEFESGHRLYLRPSGTEPKIKFYTMVQINHGSLVQKKNKAQETIQDIENFIHATIKHL